ncbi:hypothetical protein [Amycolatopsis sp. NPDC050768]|uniref:hypothetical protein n=1 Tax=Amycolatopsis sp. NPDC050768 TaxID=3154839 RepID=UPI0033E09D2D
MRDHDAHDRTVRESDAGRSADPFTNGPVHLLTDGLGNYYVPVFSVDPDTGTAVYLGTAVYRDVADEPGHPPYSASMPAPRTGD